jgi:predicted MPP superfamily phosphohydrolase
MRLYTLVLVLLLFTIILPDLFFYFKLKKHKANALLHVLNFLPTAFFLTVFLLMKFLSSEDFNVSTFHTFMWFNFTFMLIYIPKLLYILFHFINYLVNLLLKEKIYLIRYVGVLVAMFSVVLMMHGAFVNPKNPQLTKVDVPIKGLPDAFIGYTIVQISDIHLGSWGGNHSYFKPVIELVNQQHADLLVFTGDMVNNFHEEMADWAPLFQQLKSKDGKFAVLGNHDYGDYSEWKTPEDKDVNFDAILQGIQEFGFIVLRNDLILIQKDSAELELLGVCNWGKPPFPRYGNLNKVMEQTQAGIPKILLSHDPSHWRGEVLDYPDIALMLSGHTHAAQLAFDWYGNNVSPSSWVYNEWDGLYQEANQYLYVNRGLGFTGIPVRIGTSRPEITVIRLISADS